MSTYRPKRIAITRFLVRLLVFVFSASYLVSCDPGEPRTFIEYRRIGGLAGFNDRLVILTDGSGSVYRNTGSKQFYIPEETLDHLEQLLEDANFAQMRTNYKPGQGADLIQYQVTYSGKTVTTADLLIPTELEPIINQLNSLIDNGGIE